MIKCDGYMRNDTSGNESADNRKCARHLRLSQDKNIYAVRIKSARGWFLLGNGQQQTSGIFLSRAAPHSHIVSAYL